MYQAACNSAVHALQSGRYLLQGELEDDDSSKTFSIRHFALIIAPEKHEAFVSFTRLTARIILVLLWDFLPVLLDFSFSRCRLVAALLLLSSLQEAPCLRCCD